MNEQIKLLEKQCWDHQTNHLNIEKFAEIVIKECANIAYGYDLPKMSGPGMIIGGRIEQHFGVEE
jgi:hypothetical protein